MPQSYLTTSEVARALGVAASTIRHYRADGRITPRGRTPGGHARYDLAEVAASLGVSVPEEAVEAQGPMITGLQQDTFAPLGEHDLRRSGRSGLIADEIVALGVREQTVAPASATRPRWGGKLLNARRPVSS